MGTEQRFYYIKLAYSTGLGDTIVFYTNVYRKWLNGSDRGIDIGGYLP